MKKVLLAVMMMMVMAGPAASADWDKANLAAKAKMDQEDQKRRELRRVDGTDKYSNSVRSVLDIVFLGEQYADYTAYYCYEAGIAELGASFQWNRQMSDYFNSANAGSQMQCGGEHSNGMFYVKGDEFYLANGRLVRYERKTKERGLAYELSADNLIYRISDSNGNYVVMQFDEHRPGRSRYIDAKLPISLQSNGAIMADGKGVAISSNELISGLNKFYRDYVRGDKFTMPYIAKALLLEPDSRQLLVDFMSAPNAQKAKEAEETQPVFEETQPAFRCDLRDGVMPLLKKATKSEIEAFCAKRENGFVKATPFRCYTYGLTSCERQREEVEETLHFLNSKYNLNLLDTL